MSCVSQAVWTYTYPETAKQQWGPDVSVLNWRQGPQDMMLTMLRMIKTTNPGRKKKFLMKVAIFLLGLVCYTTQCCISSRRRSHIWLSHTPKCPEENDITDMAFLQPGQKMAAATVYLCVGHKQSAPTPAPPTHTLTQRPIHSIPAAVAIREATIRSIRSHSAGGHMWQLCWNTETRRVNRRVVITHTRNAMSDTCWHIRHTAHTKLQQTTEWLIRNVL